MKKVLLFATAAFLFSGVAFATDKDKGKKKKCAKGMTCCKKEAKASCSKDKKETAEFKGEPKN
jgi:hypothetical protein